MIHFQFVALCALVAATQAGLLPAAPVHYSPAEAVSSQSIVRHEQPQTYTTKLVAAPVTKYAVAAPVAYHSAPVQYSSAQSVSSQNIVRHEQPTKLVSAAPVYHAAPAPVTYHAAHAPVSYHAAPAQVYHAAPVAKVLAHPEELVSVIMNKCNHSSSA